jgi:biotin transport system substrate-specific component
MATLTAIGAIIRIPMIPVPMTLQTYFVLLAGNLLGPVWGAVSMIVYLLLGLIGLPVFAGGSGFGIVLSPTFGYLIGFPVSAYFVGKKAGVFKHKKNNKPFFIFWFIQLQGLFIVYIFGVLYLFLIKNLYIHESFPIKQAILLGFIVFLPGMMIKSMLAAITVVRLRNQIDWFR